MQFLHSHLGWVRIGFFKPGWMRLGRWACQFRGLSGKVPGWRVPQMGVPQASLGWFISWKILFRWFGVHSFVGRCLAMIHVWSCCDPVHPILQLHFAWSNMKPSSIPMFVQDAHIRDGSLLKQFRERIIVLLLLVVYTPVTITMNR
jgi:hypothetical protein